MNQLTLTHKKINNGKEFSNYTPMTEEEMKTQIIEILQDENYKKGQIKKDMVIIDCGANIGLASLYFKDYAKTIYALEPSKKYYEALVKNVAQYPHIKTFNIGLANRPGKDILRSNDKGDIPVSFWGNGQIKEPVDLTTLDIFMEEQEIEHVDLFKIDTEGAEYLILPSKGFSNVASKIDYIIGESHYINPQLVPEFIPLILKEYGFKTEFLPINNMFLEMSFEFEHENEVKRYKVNRQTLFFAQRI